jgi:hypothetical protein
MKVLTLEQAKKLKRGDVLYHLHNKNSDGTPQRWKVNGKVQTWKKDKSMIKIPIKNGLRNCNYLTEESLHLVTLVSFEKYYQYYQETFFFISDARKFQQQKRKEGYHTRKEMHSGGNPFSIIFYWK